MESKKKTCIEMLPSTHKRLKRLAVELDLTIGATISYLIDHVAPTTGDDLLKMIAAEHVE